MFVIVKYVETFVFFTSFQAFEAHTSCAIKNHGTCNKYELKPICLLLHILH